MGFGGQLKSVEAQSRDTLSSVNLKSLEQIMILNLFQKHLPYSAKKTILTSNLFNLESLLKTLISKDSIELSEKMY